MFTPTGHSAETKKKGRILAMKNNNGSFSRNNYSNNRGERKEWFAFLVNATINACLEHLKGQAGILYCGKRSTSVAAKLTRKDANTIVAQVSNSVISFVHYFGIRVTESWNQDGMYGRVCVTPSGKALPWDHVRTRDGEAYLDDHGNYVYQGLSHLAIVECKGQYGMFHVKVVSFVKGSKGKTSIEITEKNYELVMPSALTARFYTTGGRDSQLPSQSKIEQVITTAIAGLKPELQEALTPFASALAVAYRLAAGEEVDTRKELSSDTETKNETNATPAPEPKAEDKKPESKPKKAKKAAGATA
jgi:hypothetical protein